MDRLAAGGAQYTNFHVTSMCSPTRACLVTGRNAHSVGMGTIAEWAGGYPSYRGHISQRAATVAEPVAPASNAERSASIFCWYSAHIPSSGIGLVCIAVM